MDRRAFIHMLGLGMLGLGGLLGIFREGRVPSALPEPREAMFWRRAGDE